MFAPKYKVHYNKNKSCFSNAKDSYRVGEQVTLIYPFIATDTDYSFSVDGADYKLNYTDRGYELSFVMPDHEVSVNVSWRNSMMCMGS
ncbi:MAG: hypothetical protein II224_03855 [Ruminococcus sp.]|nr:hypothetical protein [Ruminococcus sp.]MBQ1974922.1 hypothetical protein [Ruminococcus sp.]